MATALAVAFVVYSCKGNLSEAEKLDLDRIPLQTVDSMFFVQSENIACTIGKILAYFFIGLIPNVSLIQNRLILR